MKCKLRGLDEKQLLKGHFPLQFARAGGATNFNHVKNQSPGHAKKVECSSTFMACLRAFRRTKNAQVRQLQRKLSNVRSARAGKATAMADCICRSKCLSVHYQKLQ
jgi:hypothetical protein